MIGDNSNSDQKVIISYFDDQGLLKSIKTYPVADEIQDEANHDASFAKVIALEQFNKNATYVYNRNCKFKIKKGRMKNEKNYLFIYEAF